MTENWAVAALILAAFAVGAAAVCMVLLMRLQHRLLAGQQALGNQAGRLDEAVQMIEARLAELHASMYPAAAGDADTESAAELGEAAAQEAMQPAIEPQIQAAIAAAAAVAIGPHARVRSARIVNPQEDASAWSQQGRVLVQTSHNLR
ncbi:MAG TPA: hypothetical protein VGL22_20410 [Terracidiphilus sp.]